MFGRKEPRNDDEAVFRTLCKTLDDAEWKYEIMNEETTLSISFEGDDLPIHMLICIKGPVMNFRSILNFSTEPENYRDVVWGLNAINDELLFGSFRLNLEHGIVNYNYSYILPDGRIPGERIRSVLEMVVSTVDSHDGDIAEIASVKRNDNSAMYY